MEGVIGLMACMPHTRCSGRSSTCKRPESVTRE